MSWYLVVRYTARQLSLWSNRNIQQQTTIATLKLCTERLYAFFIHQGSLFQICIEQGGSGEDFSLGTFEF